MQNLRAYVNFGTILCIMLSAACSKEAAPKELVALERAREAGLFTPAEYEAKKARLLAEAEALKALDKANGAGLLTKDEYAAKRAALLATENTPPQAAVEPPPSQEPAPPVAQTAALAAPVPPVAAPVSAPVSRANDGHSYRLKLAKVMDEHGFERPMVSVMMLIPVDWQMQGGTTWNIKDSCNTIQTSVRASGPDGRSYEIFPAFNWVWADDPQPLRAAAQQKAQYGTRPCDVMPPTSAQDYLRRNLPRLRPNAQLVAFEPAPKLMESLSEQARQTEQGARQYNLTQKVKFDAIRARVKYSLEGRPVEEWIFGATVTTGTLGPSLDLRSMQQVQRWTYNCVAYSGAQRAPQGQLDGSQKFFEMIGSTYRQNPEWTAKVTGNALAMQQIELKGIRDRSAIMAKSAEDTRKTQREIYENQSRSEDHVSNQFSQYQRGVETYRNPTTGETIDLDNTFGHAWVNDKGEYLLSDQAGFNPNAVSGNTATWQPLQHVKK